MAMFDVRPVDDSGSIDFAKISNIQTVLNLGRKFRISKSGEVSIKHNKPSIEYQVLSIKEGNNNSDIPNTKYVIHNTEINPAEELEKYLNEDLDPEVELVSIGGKII